MKEIPIEKLRHFFEQREEIHTALLHGSYAKGRQRESSDVDIAVLLVNKPGNVFEYQSQLSLALDDMCKKETDVLILNAASPHIAFRALKEGKIIFQKKDRALWNQFVVRAVNMNEDMEILYRKIRHWRSCPKT